MVTISTVTAASRVEIRVDEQLAGFAEYADRDGRRIFVHTEIDPAFEGQGLGGKLAKGALDDAQALGLPIVPLCPFIASYVERHPEYQPLVDTDLYEQLRPRP